MWYTAVIPELRRERQEDLSSRPALGYIKFKTRLTCTWLCLKKPKSYKKQNQRAQWLRSLTALSEGIGQSSDLTSTLGGSQMPLSSVLKASTPPSGLHGYWRTHAWTDRHIQIVNEILKRKTRVDIPLMVNGVPGLWSLWGGACGLCISYFAEIKYCEQKQLQRSRGLHCQSGKTWHGGRSRELAEPLFIHTGSRMCEQPIKRGCKLSKPALQWHTSS